jgi:hypothetical protein
MSPSALRPAENLEHLPEDGPASFAGREPFLIPIGDPEVLPRREGGDRLPLGVERDSSVLLQRRDADISPARDAQLRAAAPHVPEQLSVLRDDAKRRVSRERQWFLRRPR